MVDYNRNRTSLPTQDAWPRWVNFLVGIWLIISAFAWPHTAGARTNTWILGALIALASIWAVFTPGARFLNTIFAIWLFFATLVIYHASSATVWNNVIAAVVVFVLSLIPTPPAGARTGRQRPLHAA
jgi:SPW repeat